MYFKESNTSAKQIIEDILSNVREFPINDHTLNWSNLIYQNALLSANQMNDFSSPILQEKQDISHPIQPLKLPIIKSYTKPKNSKKVNNCNRLSIDYRKKITSLIVKRRSKLSVNNSINTISYENIKEQKNFLSVQDTMNIQKKSKCVIIQNLVKNRFSFINQNLILTDFQKVNQKEEGQNSYRQKQRKRRQGIIKINESKLRKMQNISQQQHLSSGNYCANPKLQEEFKNIPLLNFVIKDIEKENKIRSKKSLLLCCEDNKKSKSQPKLLAINIKSMKEISKLNQIIRSSNNVDTIKQCNNNKIQSSNKIRQSKQIKQFKKLKIQNNDKSPPLPLKLSQKRNTNNDHIHIHSEKQKEIFFPSKNKKFNRTRIFSLLQSPSNIQRFI